MILLKKNIPKIFLKSSENDSMVHNTLGSFQRIVNSVRLLRVFCSCRSKAVEQLPLGHWLHFSGYVC